MSSRESKLPRVWPRAPSRVQDRATGRDGKRPWTPAAGDGRAWNKWFSDCGRDPIAPTFPPRGRLTNGAVKARELGRERAVRRFWYRVRVRRGAAPRLGLCSPLGPPPRAACSGAGHHRVSLQARRLISGAPAAPGSPWAVRSALAAGWLQLQAREPRSKRPEARHSRTPCPGPASPPRPTRLRAQLRARPPSDASSH